MKPDRVNVYYFESLYLEGFSYESRGKHIFRGTGCRRDTPTLLPTLPVVKIRPRYVGASEIDVYRAHTLKFRAVVLIFHRNTAFAVSLIRWTSG